MDCMLAHLAVSHHKMRDVSAYAVAFSTFSARCCCSSSQPCPIHVPLCSTLFSSMEMLTWALRAAGRFIPSGRTSFVFRAFPDHLPVVFVVPSRVACFSGCIDCLQAMAGCLCRMQHEGKTKARLASPCRTACSSHAARLPTPSLLAVFKTARYASLCC